MRALSYSLVCLLCLALTVNSAQAQVEVGTRAGMGLVFADGGSILTFAVPGSAPSPLGTLIGTHTSAHFAFFPAGQIMVEPQLSFSVLSVSNGESETLTTIGLSAMVAYLFSSAEANSPYVGFQGTYWSVSNGGESESDFAFGGAIGYRFLPVENVAFRIEGAYRRYFDFELNEVNLAFVLGVVFG